jgi:HK97 family phage major capsid protein
VDEITKQLAELEKRLKEEADKTAKAEIKAQIDALMIKIKSGEDAAKELADFKVKYDEADKATQKSLDEMSAKIKGLQGMQKGEEPAEVFAKSLKKGIEDNHDDLQKLFKGEKSMRAVGFDVKTVGDITTANITGGSVWGAIYKPGIIEGPNRKVHMRQVVNTGNIGPGTDYYFMAENGTGEGSIAFTAETSTKPQKDFDLVESSVKIECLAGWARISKKALNNVPGMVRFLQSRLPEALLRAEDAGILYGSGSTPIIKGLFTSPNYTSDQSTSDILAESIIDNLAYMEDTLERNPGYVLVRPIDYWSFFKNKASTSGEYDLPFNFTFVNGQLYVGGVPVFTTTALTAGDYGVFDRMGCDFLFQENYRIEFFYEDGTNVRENKVTVRIEEYVALPVYGASFNILGAVPSGS